MSEGDERGLAPAEGALVSLLGLLGDDPPPTGARFTDDVMRTARWQYAVRGSLVAVGHLAQALVEGVALLAGARARPPS